MSESASGEGENTGIDASWKWADWPVVAELWQPGTEQIYASWLLTKVKHAFEKEISKPLNSVPSCPVLRIFHLGRLSERCKLSKRRFFLFSSPSCCLSLVFLGCFKTLGVHWVHGLSIVKHREFLIYRRERIQFWVLDLCGAGQWSGMVHIPHLERGKMPVLISKLSTWRWVLLATFSQVEAVGDVLIVLA